MILRIGEVLTHIGCVDVTAPGLAKEDLDLGSDDAALPGGPNLSAFFSVKLDPNTNPIPADAEMNGEYDLGSFWLWSPGL